MDYNKEQARIVNEVKSLLTPCSKKGRGWGRYRGDVTCRVVAEHIHKHLPSNYKVAGPSVYIEDLPWEFDLMVVTAEASPKPCTNAYQANQVHRVLEIKKHGLYGKRDELEQIIKAPMYLTVEETVKPIKRDAIRYADITRKALHPYHVFVLQDTRGKRLQEGEWQRFAECITEGMA